MIMNVPARSRKRAAMNPKDIVRTGYDKISHAYRGDTLDQNDPVSIRYTEWVTELIVMLPTAAAVLDLGCGNGIPVAKLLIDAGFAVTGVDISPVQIARAQAALPIARFVCADMTELAFAPETFAAIVSFYAIIHIPVAEQPALLANIYHWLQPGGYFMATVGSDAWTGTEADWLDVAGGLMYWSHADTATYQQWCENQGFRICWIRFIPEGNGGHTLLLAHKPAA
jgi:SAM-dependent methyltransferase